MRKRGAVYIVCAGAKVLEAWSTCSEYVGCDKCSGSGELIVLVLDARSVGRVWRIVGTHLWDPSKLGESWQA